MTIELLLTMQGQGASASSSHPAASSSPRATHGMFLQALTQAATSQHQARTPTNAQAENTSTVPLSDIVDQIASLDSELDGEALANVAANVVANVNAHKQPADNRATSIDTQASSQSLDRAPAAPEQALTSEHDSALLANDSAETSTPITIEEVAARLALIASYSAPSPVRNEAVSSASTNSAAPKAASSLETATTQASSDNPSDSHSDSVKPANASPFAASFLEHTALPMHTALADRALATEPTPLARTQGQNQTQTLSPNQLPSVQTSFTAANSGASSVAPHPAAQAAANTSSPPVASSTTNLATPEALSAAAPSANAAPAAPPLTASGGTTSATMPTVPRPTVTMTNASTATALQDTPTSAIPREVQIALTGESAVANAPQAAQALTQATTQAAANTGSPPVASSTTNLASPQALSAAAPSANAAPAAPPLTANGGTTSATMPTVTMPTVTMPTVTMTNASTATTLQDTPTSAIPREVQIALTGESAVANAPQAAQALTQATTQAAANTGSPQVASSTTNLASPQALSAAAPSANAAPAAPPLSANDGTTSATMPIVTMPTVTMTNASTATALQDTPTSAIPREVQIALTGESAVANAPQAAQALTQATTQAAANTGSPPVASSTTNFASPQALPAAAPSANASPAALPLTANGGTTSATMPTVPRPTVTMTNASTATALQDTPTSAIPREVQIALSGESAVANAPQAAQALTQATTQATTQAAAHLGSSSLASALAAATQQTVSNTSLRPTTPTANARSAETVSSPANAPTLMASLETIPTQPFTTMPPGMHALSPLNTALASAPAMSADAMVGLPADAESANAINSTSKGSEQSLPTSLTSQPQPMPNSPATATLNTPLASPAWPSQLGQQLIQFAQRGGEHQVKMQLHPTELGPLSITLKVTEQGTQAHFLSSHAPVRQAIEQAIPQLREALAEQGISLGETSVGEQQTPNEQAFAQQMPNQTAGDRLTESGGESVPLKETSTLPLQDGRVDLYA
ncbi:flagellar hook-length control protein FliK [Halomonas qinghailakensis]|uniref:Flagellar hook-length control protein FliK n=1 Tax=Halomonas qinghailakensis TaxID=2937790 RepID=A0AA46YQ53_9GAMM|nr:flagellar hook-length control protein FliK [Halomonas sp. ZZQ-149]UYO75921.1 flagellar hook-length control protein FliK [Halomonas sp. ZZQ-149]